MPEMLSWFLLVSISHAIFFFILLYIIVNLEKFKTSVGNISALLNNRIEKYKEKRKNKISKKKEIVPIEPVVNDEQQYYEPQQIIMKERITIKEIVVLVLLMTWTLVIIAAVVYFFKTLGLF
jgi:hypothetical protein